MKRSANRIAASQQATPAAKEYVFDEVDGSQMALWTCGQTATSSGHAHEFNEYMIVGQGCYTILIGDTRMVLPAGDE